MSIDELKKKFIVDDDVLANRLEAILEKALNFCVLDKKGAVHISDPKMPTRDKIRLVLSARAIAAQIEESISADVAVADICDYVGVEQKQVSARLSEIVDDRFAVSVAKGVFRANPRRIDAFLDGLKSADKNK